MDIAFFIFFPICIFYWEIILNISTKGSVTVGHACFMAMFSFAFGALPTILSSLSHKPAINKTIKAILLVVLALPFMVVYFVYCEFQIFYDLNTMLAGAGGAVTVYFDDIIELIVNANSFIHIAIFLMPFLAYIIILLKEDEAPRLNVKKLISIVGAAVLSFALSTITIFNIPGDREVFTDEYSFGESITRFGLCKSLTREVANAVKTEVVGETVEFVYMDEDNFVETNSQENVQVPPDTENSATSEAYATSEKAEQKPLTPEPFFEPLEEYPEPVFENIDNKLIGFSNQPDATIYKYVETDRANFGVNKLDIDFAALASTEGISKSLANLDNYVAMQRPSSKNQFTGYFKGKNLIFISAEAFCAEAVDPVLTPTLYRMATRGIQFTDYYQPALSGTTGGEYHNIFGMLATESGESVKNTQDKYNYMTMGTQLDRLGYTGKVYHNGNYTFYDRNLTHINLGYSDGFTANGNGLEDIVDKKNMLSDIAMMEATLPIYMDKQPFNLYYMSVSGHSSYNRTANYYANKYWKEVEGYDYTDLVKGYLSTQIEFDRAMEWTINALEEAGLADDTVIVISADHFPYGLDNEGGGGYENLSNLYGYDVHNSFQRDHSRLIIWSGCLEQHKPIRIEEPTYSIDILPTLLNLFGVDFDSRLLPGRDVFSDKEALVFSTNYNWISSLGTYQNGTFKPNNTDEVIPDGYVENMKNEVKNRITYMRGVVPNDYYRHVFYDTYKEDKNGN